MDTDTEAPTGLPNEEPEDPPMGVPASDDDPEVEHMPGIPDEGEPPSAG
ncbi:MAG: hypothetical protein QOH62_938 [Solirubrobacteraceae bacterium]|jgi:hypothetical protein|nr:hypothetical protein [Solirubrobacteraceae bacterium]